MSSDTTRNPDPTLDVTADVTADVTDAESPEPADRVAAAVLAVPGVHDLHGGVLGEVATYLPGRRVAGIRLLDGITQVHLVLAWDAPVAATVDEVRRRVSEILPGVVHVAVEDVAGPGETTPDQEVDA